MNAKPMTHVITSRNHYWLLAAIAIVVIPHLLRVPFTVSGLTLVLMIWRFMMARFQWPLPNRFVRILLLLLALFAVVSSFGTLLGRDAGVALLVAMLGLKTLEMDRLRDVYIALFIGYFLVITEFFYNESLATAAYMIVAVAVVTAALVDLNRSADAQPANVHDNMRASAQLFAQAIPVTLILFFLFPRVPGPLWGLPQDAFGGRTGLSDRMSPGEISQLSLSDEVAFRARFDGPIPGVNSLYWRGPVFWYTDGRAWYPEHDRRLYMSPGASQTLVPEGNPVSYTVTLEPHGRPWLYALDLATTMPSDFRRTVDYQLHAEAAVENRMQYAVVSHTRYRFTGLAPAERAAALQLPGERNPRTVELGRRWRQLFGDRDGAVVQAALSYFNEAPFKYTLTPAVLASDNPSDEFLFGTLEGFCEHYASAFTVLMRAAGIPARVVTGYQGGEYNKLGDYLTIRQRDAHAWAEVWLDNQGWVRIDPTAAVAPERVELGMEATMRQREGAEGFQLDADSWAGRTWLQMRQGWDALNNGWNEWVLTYDQDRQNKLLQHVGLDRFGWRALAAALILSLCTVMGILLYRTYMQTGARIDPVQRQWQRFCAKLQKRGLDRDSHEGPQQFANRVILARPDLSAAVAAITDLYTSLRYQRSAPDQALRRLRREVRRFKP